MEQQDTQYLNARIEALEVELKKRDFAAKWWHHYGDLIQKIKPDLNQNAVEFANKIMGEFEDFKLN